MHTPLLHLTSAAIQDDPASAPIEIRGWTPVPVLDIGIPIGHPRCALSRRWCGTGDGHQRTAPGRNHRSNARVAAIGSGRSGHHGNNADPIARISAASATPALGADQTVTQPINRIDHPFSLQRIRPALNQPLHQRDISMILPMGRKSGQAASTHIKLAGCGLGIAELVQQLREWNSPAPSPADATGNAPKRKMRDDNFCRIDLPPQATDRGRQPRIVLEAARSPASS